MSAREKKQTLRRRASLLPKIDAPALVERFLALPQVAQAETVMLYCGVGRELDTAPLLTALLTRGKRVVYPVCLPGRRMECRAVTGPQQLVPGAFGIPAPGPDCPVVGREEIDVALIPCLMCDRDGYRLGFGGGYYDRWLAGWDGFTVCICPPDRLADALPRDDFDVPVKLVLSE